MEQKPTPPDESLETLDGVQTQTSSAPKSSDSGQPQNVQADQETLKSVKLPSVVSSLTSRLNIYLLLLVFMIVASLVIAYIVIDASSGQDEATSTQTLTQDTIDKLTSNESVVGDPKQLLTVASNSVFAGSVLVKDSLEVAGGISVGDSLNLPGLTVSGTTTLGDVQANRLSASGDTTLQGGLSVEQNLAVTGQSSLAATSVQSLTASSIEVVGPLTINGRISTTGNLPGVTSGSALGSGGSATISGTDTAGTVTVNVGSSAGNGALASVTFSGAFSNTPHVVITAVTNTGGGGQFYLSARSTTGFTIATSSSLPTGTISFDYIVID